MPKFIFFILCSFSLHAQGPLDGYLKGKGTLDLVPSFSFHRAEKFQSSSALFDERYQGQSLQLFAEYGISKKLDVVATGAVVFTQLQSGLQDGGLYLKYRPLHLPLRHWGKLGILTGIGISAPLSDYQPTATGALGQKAITAPVYLIVQWDSPLGLFLNAGAGYHHRFDRLSKEDIALVQQQRPDYKAVGPVPHTTFLIKAGFPARHFYVDAWVEWQWSEGGNDYVPNVPDLAQAFGVGYTQIGGTFFYSDNGRSGFFCSGGYILRGRNISLIRRITFGISRKFG